MIDLRLDLMANPTFGATRIGFDRPEIATSVMHASRTYGNEGITRLTQLLLFTCYLLSVTCKLR